MRKPRSLRLKNDSTYRDNDWWDWSLWLDGPKPELDRVDRVEYVLHSTFVKPVRTVSDRATNFRLVSSGWGEFKVRATVHFRDGRQTRLQHWLRLQYPDSKTVEPPQSQESPRVFLSYSITDRDEAAKLVKVLRNNGIEVASREEAPPALPLEQWVVSQLQKVNASLVLVSSAPSASRQSEIELANRSNVPVVPVLLGTAKVPAGFRGTEVIRIGSPERMDRAVPKLLQLLQ